MHNSGRQSTVTPCSRAASMASRMLAKFPRQSSGVWFKTAAATMIGFIFTSRLSHRELVSFSNCTGIVPGQPDSYADSTVVLHLNGTWIAATERDAEYLRVSGECQLVARDERLGRANLQTAFQV